MKEVFKNLITDFIKKDFELKKEIIPFLFIATKMIITLMDFNYQKKL